MGQSQPAACFHLERFTGPPLHTHTHTCAHTRTHTPLATCCPRLPSQAQSQVVVTLTAKPKIFALSFYTEKACQPCSKMWCFCVPFKDATLQTDPGDRRPPEGPVATQPFNGLCGEFGDKLTPPLAPLCENCPPLTSEIPRCSRTSTIKETSYHG